MMTKFRHAARCWLCQDQCSWADQAGWMNSHGGVRGLGSTAKHSQLADEAQSRKYVLAALRHLTCSSLMLLSKWVVNSQVECEETRQRGNAVKLAVEARVSKRLDLAARQHLISLLTKRGSRSDRPSCATMPHQLVGAATVEILGNSQGECEETWLRGNAEQAC